MANYRKFRELSSEDSAYIAGLIDGEGTVTLTRKHKSENRQLCVSISSTEKALLEFVLEATGVGKITNKRTISPRHSPSFTYAVYNRHALQILEQTQPYLKTYKKHRAKIILKDYVRLTPRNGKYTTELLAARKEFENAVLGLKANVELTK